MANDPQGTDKKLKPAIDLMGMIHQISAYARTKANGAQVSMDRRYDGIPLSLEESFALLADYADQADRVMISFLEGEGYLMDVREALGGLYNYVSDGDRLEAINIVPEEFYDALEAFVDCDIFQAEGRRPQPMKKADILSIISESHRR